MSHIYIHTFNFLWWIINKFIWPYFPIIKREIYIDLLAYLQYNFTIILSCFFLQFEYYRILLCDREESRPSESFFRTVLKPVFYFFPTAISTPTEVVARAMVNNAISPPSENRTELFENKAIHMMAGNLKPKPEDMVKPVKKSTKETDDNQEL